MPGLENLFQPIAIRGLSVKNRLAMAPMVMNLASSDGSVSPQALEHYARRARGGVGLIIAEATYVRKDGKAHQNGLGIDRDEMVGGLSELTARVHEAGAKISIQLNHAGRQTTSATSGTTPVAPSAIPCPVMQEIPRELTAAELPAIQEAFASAAARAKRAGFDAVEIHGAHGYLIAEFLSPHTNHRTDGYGGGLRERTRFAREVLEKVRLAVGPDFPVFFKISATELVDGGLTLSQTKVIAPMLVEAGADALHVSVGNYAAAGEPHIATLDSDVAPLVLYAEAIKSVVPVPVITVNRVHDVALADQIIGQGRADMVAMGRALLADPDLPLKALQGRTEDILPCIACNQGCVGMLAQGKSATCLVNPACGRELEMAIEPAPVSRKVLVVGGGPAGMEAARVAALRGHAVTLLEQQDRLGGEFLVAGMPHTKQAILPALSWLSRQIDRAGVKVELGVEATPDLIRRREPDVVIVATGATPTWLAIPGLTSANTVLARDLLLGRASTERRTVVVGGGATGLEVAHYLSLLGKDVTVLEMTGTLGADMEASRRYWAIEALERHRVVVHCNTRLVGVEGGSAILESSGATSMLPGPSTIVLCCGYAPTGPAWDAIKDQPFNLHIIGDACSPRTALEAIYEGARVARVV